MKLVWDKTGEKQYETGLDHGVLYLQDERGDYSSGEVWNGLINVSESPGGAEATDIYADNIKYGSLRSAETFGATIEAYTYPDSFEECDGSKQPIAGVHVGQQERKPFGLSYRTEIHNDTATETDDGYKLHLVYGASAAPSEKAYASINESPEAMTFSWEITTTPVNVTGLKPTASITIDSRKVNKETLKAFEDVLYGTDPASGSGTGVAAKLPKPDEVIDFFKDSGILSTSINTFKY